LQQSDAKKKWTKKRKRKWEWLGEKVKQTTSNLETGMFLSGASISTEKALILLLLVFKVTLTLHFLFKTEAFSRTRIKDLM